LPSPPFTLFSSGVFSAGCALIEASPSMVKFVD
jgi:hypothetical protein